MVGALEVKLREYIRLVKCEISSVVVANSFKAHQALQAHKNCWPQRSGRESTLVKLGTFLGAPASGFTYGLADQSTQSSGEFTGLLVDPLRVKADLKPVDSLLVRLDRKSNGKSNAKSGLVRLGTRFRPITWKMLGVALSIAFDWKDGKGVWLKSLAGELVRSLAKEFSCKDDWKYG